MPQLLLSAICLIAVVGANGHPGEGGAHERLHKRIQEGTEILLEKTTVEYANDEFEVEVHSTGPLGIKFNTDMNVIGFHRDSNGNMFPAEKSELIKIGDRLIGINNDDIEELGFKDVMQVLQETKNSPRLLLFRVPAGKTVNDRKLSEVFEQSEAEHLDVFSHTASMENIKAGGLLFSYPIFLSKEFGAQSSSCTRHKVIMAKPEDGCQSFLENGFDGSLRGKIVLVRRGMCSFLHKALNLQKYQVAGVIVINSEPNIFRMRKEGSVEQDLRMPVAMISSVDGEELIRYMETHEGVSARFIISSECVHYEKEEHDHLLKIERENRFDSESEATETITFQKRFGKLTQSGRLHVVSQSITDIEADKDGNADINFEFLTAPFSGPVPVDIKISISSSTMPMRTGSLTPRGVIVSIHEHELLDRLDNNTEERGTHFLESVVGKYERADVGLVILACDWSIIEDILPLPSHLTKSYIIVTPYAVITDTDKYTGNALLSKLMCLSNECNAGNMLSIRLEGDSTLKTYWDELHELASNDFAWPPKESKSSGIRLAKRLKKLHKESNCRSRLLSEILEKQEL